jgi:AraC family transcriptional regulator of adaptative response/methylated-DNA-[protein]-cysteine methyltransferase
MIGLPSVKTMDRAIRERDTSFDGVFFTAVRTTGIFCRPSCPAKTPLPRNRRYFGSAREAALAGYRPCKRCRPLDTSGRPPIWVDRLLAEVERNPSARFTDAQLRKLGIEPARARRYFVKHYAMTFQTYCRERRMGNALLEIGKGADLDQVVLANGYESPSGFREAFRKTFGQPPGRSRGTDCVVIDWMESPLGPLVMAAKAEGVCLLDFLPYQMEAHLARLRDRFDCAVVPGNHPNLELLKEELRQYFAGRLTQFHVPLVYRGSPFQMKVWDRLRKIPYGETLSYQALAQSIGKPRAQRAVGLQNGQNPIAIVIPCHRVVNKNGRLGGYGGGLWRKKFLLDLERRVIESANNAQ